MEKLTENMIRFAENKLGSTEYAGWCLAFIEDALEISNHIEIFGSFVTPRYVYTDADRYDYLVKYPDYLTFTGNMSVGWPTTEENVFTDALIMWPEVSSGYKFGVLLYENDMEYAIYIDSEGNALSKEDEDIVSRHSDIIRSLFMKADERGASLTETDNQKQYTNPRLCITQDSFTAIIRAGSTVRRYVSLNGQRKPIGLFL